MALGDVVLTGFGNTGWLPFNATLGNTNGRIIRQIIGTRARVDVLGVDGNVIWDTALSNTFGGVVLVAEIEIIRCGAATQSLPAGIAGGISQVLATSQYPGGFESLWANVISSPSAATPTAAGNVGYGAGAPGMNSFRFDPGVISADQDHKLFVVCSMGINFGHLNIWPEFVNQLRRLSVVGFDYGQSRGEAGNVAGARSYPRFGVPL